MTHIVLAVTPPHGAASSIGSGTYWFAIGLLAGFAAALLAPGWLKGLIILFDLVALGWTSGILNYTHTANGRWILIAVPFLLVGLFVGVVRGLRHLGDTEFRGRLANVRKAGKYF